jgi:hypothetical protein
MDDYEGDGEMKDIGLDARQEHGQGLFPTGHVPKEEQSP